MMTRTPFWQTLTLSGLLCLLPACFGEQQSQEAVSNEQGQQGEEGDMDLPEDTPDTPDNPTADLTNGLNDLAQESNAGSTNTTANTAPPVNAAPEASPPLAPTATPSSGSDRVVRYITTDGTGVYPTADANAAPVATLSQGDIVVVSMQGAWGQLMEGRYVAAANLSEKAIPRPKADPWGTPAAASQPTAAIPSSAISPSPSANMTISELSDNTVL